MITPKTIWINPWARFCDSISGTYHDFRLTDMDVEYRLVDPSEPDPKTCKWHYDGDMYETECGTAFYFNDGTAQENNANYCHKCGNLIEIEESDDD